MASISFVPQVSSVGGSTTVAAKSMAPAQETAASVSQDSVKLSVAAQVKMMHHQGLSPNTISAQVGIPVSQVDSYLPGVSTAASSTSGAPQPAPSESDSSPAASKASAQPASTTPQAAPAPAKA